MADEKKQVLGRALYKSMVPKDIHKGRYKATFYERYISLKKYEQYLSHLYLATKLCFNDNSASYLYDTNK